MIKKLLPITELLEDNHQGVSVQIAKKVNEIIDVLNKKFPNESQHEQEKENEQKDSIQDIGGG